VILISVSHNRDFIYQPRGFNNIWDHDEQIIKNWNNVIQPEDEVYHLGDIMLGDSNYGLSCLKQLKGNIHIIRGNHDTDTRMSLYNQCRNVIEITEGQYFKYEKYHFYLSHFPCIVDNYDTSKPLKTRMISLCGHSHTKDKFCDMNKGFIYHCELDAHNCYPINIEQILMDIKNYNKEN